MDILFNNLKSLWFVIPLLAVGLIVKTSWFKGWMGEVVVRMANKFMLPAGEYSLINDVTLEIEGETTQVDHVVVSTYGVFVIETKNMSGWIFGGERGAIWTQKIYRNTFRFQNPLRQNYKHIKAIEALTGVEIQHLHSVIVFINGKIKTLLPDNVTQGLGYIKYIKSFKEHVLTTEQVNAVVATIETLRLDRSIKVNRQHVAQLRERHGRKHH